jgi:hypothetical protein
VAVLRAPGHVGVMPRLHRYSSKRHCSGTKRQECLGHSKSPLKARAKRPASPAVAALQPFNLSLRPRSFRGSGAVAARVAPR